MRPIPIAVIARWSATVALGVAAAGALAQKAEPPKYGGTLEVATVTTAVTPMSWDLADWVAATHPRDTGQFYEQLFVANLDMATSHGGKYEFALSGWEPTEAKRGELAESWTWTDPLTLEVKLRKGIKFPAKKGVMDEREFFADDVVYHFNRMNTSPKRTQTYYDHIDKVEATDRYTVVIRFNKFIADWDYRFGNGFFGGIQPKEVIAAGPGDWKNANGTGPFLLANYVTGNALMFDKNPIYWDKEVIDGKEYKLPYVDHLVHRVLKDEATQQSALRTAKIDILSSMVPETAKTLKQTTPQLKWHRFLTTDASRIALRVDAKPFTDVRVRRALNMAVNKQEIIDKFYDGEAEMFTFPMHPVFVGYHKPLKDQPASVQELFRYDPVKAKKLLAEAGYPNGFTFKMQLCSCTPAQMELMPLVAAYLEAVGVKMEIQPTEYAAHLSAMSTNTNLPGYLTGTADVNPTTSLRINFGHGQVYNAPNYNDPEFDAKVVAANGERDEAKRQQMLQELTSHILDQAPAIWMPAPYRYTAWWPWVKNYNGELYAGEGRAAPIYARIWIDQELKKKMGY